MKIANIRATPVNIPLEAPFWWAGELYPGASKAPDAAALLRNGNAP
jgi:hypothetical protein